MTQRPRAHQQSCLRATVAAAGLAAVSVAAMAVPAGAAAGPDAAATKLLAWGVNDVGQLGNGTKTDFSKVPVRAILPKGTRLRSVSAGCGFSLAVTTSGKLLSWGTNRDGRLGLGPGGPRSSPVPVTVRIPGGGKITAAAAGCHHALALTASGRVLAWGRSNLGQTGTGQASGAPVLTPTAVRLPAGTRVISIAAGFDTSMAVTAGGNVWTWGTSQFGQLGIGMQGGPGTFSATPVRVPLPAGVRGKAAATGTVTDYAVTRGGNVWAWGMNSFGELGNGRSGGHVNRPVKVRLPAGTKVASLAAGCYFALARTTAGPVLGWGDNNSGQLAIHASQTSVPVRPALPAGVRVTALGASCRSSLARTADGRVLAWGLNARGELGTGGPPPGTAPNPAPVHLPAGFTTVGIGAGSQAHGGYALGY